MLGYLYLYIYIYIHVQHYTTLKVHDYDLPRPMVAMDICCSYAKVDV